MIFLLIGLLSWSPPLAEAQEYSVFLGKKSVGGKLEGWEMHSNIPNPENGKVYFVTVYSMSNKFSPMGASVVYHEQSESFEILSGHILLGAEGAVPSQPNIGPVKPGHIYFGGKSPHGGKVNSGPMPSQENPSVERETPSLAPDSGGKTQVETKGGKNTSPQASNADSRAAPAQPKKSSGVEQSLSNAAKAGVAAGVVTGISRGVIFTPKDQRELADLQKQAEASASRMQQKDASFAQEKAALGKALLQGGENFESAVEKLQSLPRTIKESPNAFHTSEAGKKVAKAREDLLDFEPSDQAGEGLKEFGLAVADASEEAYLEGSYPESEQFAELAEATAGIALGLNPISSLVQDGFELFTGRNFASGRTLSEAERALAGIGFVAGLASGGVGSSLVKATATAGKLLARQSHAASAVMKNVTHLGNHVTGLGLKTAKGWDDFVQFSRKTLGNELGAVGNVKELVGKTSVGKWAKDFEIRRIHPVDRLNSADILKGRQPSYRHGGVAFDFTSKKSETFLRFHGDGSPAGRWVVRPEAVDRSLDSLALQQKYSLPFTPTHVSKVEVAPGAMIRRSKASAVFNGNEGAVQYEILEVKNGVARFSDTKEISKGGW